MARALNTSHPLYGNLISLIGVEDDGLTVKDFANSGRAVTKAAACVIGSGNYGYHAYTSHSGSRSLGLTLAPRIDIPDNATIFMVVNDVRSFNSQWGGAPAGGYSAAQRRTLIGADTAVQAYNTAAPLIGTTDETASPLYLEVRNYAGNTVITGTTAMAGTTSCSIALTRTGETASELFLDGVSEGTGGALATLANSPALSSIGGYVGWDYGYNEAAHVWFAVFDKVLSSTEIADLHATLAADNVFGLISTGGSGNTISAIDKEQYTIYPFASGAAAVDVQFVCTYTGADPESVEIRLLEHGTTTVVLDWQTLDEAPADGVGVGFVSVPVGGWYDFEVRYSDDTATAHKSVVEFGVGVVVGAMGQSHLVGFNADGTGTASSRMVVHNGSVVAASGTAGAGRLAMMAALESAFGCPVGWVQYSVSGTAIELWYDDATGEKANFTSWQARADDFVGLSAFVWWQGDADAVGAKAKAAYLADMSALAARLRTDYGADLPIICMGLGRKGGGADTTWEAIRDAHVNFADADADNWFVTTIDLEQGGDQQHFVDAGEIVAGNRIAAVVVEALGGAGGSQGPRVSGVAKIDNSTIEIDITHDGGSDITPATGITGFSFYDGATPVATSAVVRHAANKVRATLAAPVAGDVTVRNGYGAYPDMTAPLRDDTTLALPLMSTEADWLASAPSNALDGAAQAQPTASAALTVPIALAGAALSVATAAGSVTVPIDLAGVAVSVADAGGNLQTGIQLSGAALASAMAAAGIGGAADLAGDALGESSAGAALTIGVQLSAQAFALAVAAADLSTTPAGLEGAALGVSSAAGILSVPIALVGNAAAVATGAGGLGVPVPLEGFAAGVSEATGQIVMVADLSGAAAAMASGFANLSISVSLAGAAVAQVSAMAALSGGSVPMSAGPRDGYWGGRMYGRPFKRNYWTNT